MSNQQVRKGEELPEAKLKEFLQQRELINSTDSELFVKQFTHGYSNLTYLLTIEGRDPATGSVPESNARSTGILLFIVNF